MRKTKIFTIMFLLALLTLGTGSLHSAYAINVKLNKKEKRTISGVVLDENKLPMIGVNVWVKETSIGTATDTDGRFTLKLDPGQNVIVASFIGYAKQEIILNGKTKVKIQLKLDDKSLDEVVVVGFGSQKKESVIGAITTIKPDRLKSGGGSMISNTLAGQTSGLVVVRRSGEPRSQSEFYIRGINTFSGKTEPLVLVDGIERSLDLVNPDDIESFSILKDATATAVYGVRGANGVIIVKTKKGVIGKPVINVRAEKGFKFPMSMPKMVNSMQWAELYNEAKGEKDKKYTDEIIEKYRTGSDPDLYPNVNWFDELYKSSYGNHNVNVNITGGGSLARYYVSTSYYHEGSLYKDDNSNNYDASQKYNKFHFRGNIDMNLTPSTILNINLANIYQDRTEPGISTKEVWKYAFRTAPNSVPKRYSDGKLSRGQTYRGRNPYNFLMHTGYLKDYWVSAQSVVQISQDLSDLVTPGLSANIKYSWDAKNHNRIIRSKKPSEYFATGRKDGKLVFKIINEGDKYLGYKYRNSGERKTYLEASLKYARTFNDKHAVGGLLLFNQYELNHVGTRSAIKSLPSRNQGLAARATYAYDNKYFTEVNAGYNGSENFSPGKRFGLFPSIAAGWLISNENFFQPIINVVDMLKIKGSYGLVGSDKIGGRRFIYESTMASPSLRFPFLYGKTANKGSSRVLRVGYPENSSVSWEQAAKLNLGLEISFFKKLKMNINYFHEYRTGIFMERKSLPGIVGLSSPPWTNVGEMKNQGIDASLNFMYKIGDLYLTARGTFSFARNEVLNDDLPPWKYSYQNYVGKPSGTQFALKAIKLFESQDEIDNSPKQTYGPVRVGDLKYEDVNKDGKVDDTDQVAMKYNGLPEINYGFGLTAEYKGFNLSMLFNGVAHTSFYTHGTSIYGFPNTSSDIAAINIDVYNHRWHEGNPNPYAKYPRLTYGKNMNNQKYSTWLLRDGSFLRLKNIELGYNFPEKWINNTFISGMRLYISAQNLLRFSKFKLWDPELNVSDGNKYPFTRTVIVGLNLKI